MIKYETIISNFDDKVTLYNWLRKVEEALKNASATNFVVNKKGNATLSFSITFADGTTLESGDIVLQQGESVDDARIASGVLQLHLTNGTWLTAGNLGAVSGFSINASQHLIVTYQDGTTQDLGAIFQGDINIAGNLTATGTIDGNKVTGNEIAEKMTGYYFNAQSVTGLNIDNIYCSVVKNGNKVTFVTFQELERTADITDYQYVAQFQIPTAVWNKLYPYVVGSLTNVIANQVVQAFSSRSSHKDLYLTIQKADWPGINFLIDNVMQLTLNTKYLMRIEVTFLLSDNLAQ